MIEKIKKQELKTLWEAGFHDGTVPLFILSLNILIMTTIKSSNKTDILKSSSHKNKQF